MNISSAIGRSPVAAAPTAVPIRPISAIGVSRTRFMPNSPTSPRVVPSTPPISSVPSAERSPPPATSSPIRITFGSLRIAIAMASLIAPPVWS